MNKIMKIEGMSCGHCSARVENTLNAIENITATVDLESGTVKIQLSSPVEDKILISAVNDLGYKVIEYK